MNTPIVRLTSKNDRDVTKVQELYYTNTKKGTLINEFVGRYIKQEFPEVIEEGERDNATS